LSGSLSSLEAAEFPFFLDPLEGTEITNNLDTTFSLSLIQYHKKREELSLSIYESGLEERED
jgi:hypothetical protein